MSDFSKIKLNGTDINCKDATARAGLKIHSLSGRKTLLLGDSYNNGVGGNTGYGWGYYFQQITSADAVIIHQNAGGFVAPGSSNATYPNKNFSEALTEYASGLTTDQKNAFEYVIIAGGYNDHSYASSAISTYVTNCASNAKTLFPNAKIWIIPLYCGRSVSAAEYRYYGEDIIAAAKDAGVATNGNTFSWFYRVTAFFYASDNIHYNDTGYQKMGWCIASLVNGWDGDLNPHMGLGWTPGTNVTEGGNGFRYVRRNGHTSINGSLVYDGTPTTGNILGTINVRFIPSKSIYFTAFMYASSVSDRAVVPMMIDSDGQIYIRDAGSTLPANPTFYFSLSFDYGM